MNNPQPDPHLNPMDAVRPEEIRTKSRAFRMFLKVVLPIVVFALSAWAAYSLVQLAEEPEPRPVEAWIPSVEVMHAEPETIRLDVQTYGTVQPRTEIVLAPQVSGKVDYVSPDLKSGGFFKKGEPLVRLEAREYELAITQAESLVAKAKAALDRERAEARVALDEWKNFSDGDADPLVLRKPQLAEAQATLASGVARLERARLDLERTCIKAPFDGRVIRQQVDIGRYVTTGSAMGTIHATDYVEVRLEVPDDQLAFLDLPLCGQVMDGADDPRLEVRLTAMYGDEEVAWTGRLVRTEAEVDPTTRVVRALVRVEEPYRTSPPLMKGMYVEAVIPGRVVNDVVVLPRRLVRPKNRIYIVDSESRLSIRTCSPLKKEAGRVVFTSGIGAGDRICVTDLHPVVDGMKVRVIEDGE